MILQLIDFVAADIPPYGYIKTGGMALFSWLIFISSTVLITVLVKKKTRITLRFMIPLWGLFAFFTISFLYGVLFALFGLLAVFLGASQESRIKEIEDRYVKKPKEKSLFITILVLIAILSQAGMFGMENKLAGRIVTTDWAKLKPLHPSIIYSGTLFNASFINTAGARIAITDVSMNETLADRDCTPTTPLPGTVVIAGDQFTLEATCPAKSTGDPFDLSITVNYTSIMGGINVSHMETGHIMGTAESV
jgi:uncharacterized membrane protein YidH (DUF202 family)